jgi:hypothetical protein
MIPRAAGSQCVFAKRFGLDEAPADLASGRGRTFVWDGENRPASIKMGS